MKRWMLPALLPATVGLMIGCAGTPDCRDAESQAAQAAEARAPLSTWLGGIAPRCRAPAERAWHEALLADCAPLLGFHAARTGQSRPARCDDPSFSEAWNLGALIGEMEQEKERIEARLAEAKADGAEARRLRQQLLVIERDAPQVEALARMQGYLPPAEVPDRPED